MPRGDGTGPLGQGPRTGRGLGPCANTNTQNPANVQDQTLGQRIISGFSNVFGFGRGQGRGSGSGQGRGGGRGRNR